MRRRDPILAQLAAEWRVTARVVILVAHPDDETIGMGAQLRRFDDALLVHITDGAPRDGHDARNYGFARLSDYAAARQAELAAALAAGDAGRVRTRCLDIPDGEAWRDLTGLIERVRDLLQTEQPAAVFTHAYEGGHPDHDAAAVAVQAASRAMDGSPELVEMPLYHRREGRLITNRFATPSPGRQLCVVRLDAADIERKRRMIDCFGTQLWLLRQFDLATERFRIAPEYDLRQPPHAGELHYETVGWGITGENWRRAAAAALDRLDLDRCR